VFFRGGLPWLLLMENRPGGLAKGNAGHFAATRLTWTGSLPCTIMSHE
jgi:hypothetical protein